MNDDIIITNDNYNPNAMSDSDKTKLVGKKIRSLRTFFELTQKQLSEKSKLSIQSIRNWEGGHYVITPANLIVLSKTFYEVAFLKGGYIEVHAKNVPVILPLANYASVRLFILDDTITDFDFALLSPDLFEDGDDKQGSEIGNGDISENKRSSLRMILEMLGIDSMDYNGLKDYGLLLEYLGDVVQQALENYMKYVEGGADHGNNSKEDK